jgi:hypothetical protein
LAAGEDRESGSHAGGGGEQEEAQEAELEGPKRRRRGLESPPEADVQRAHEPDERGEDQGVEADEGLQPGVGQKRASEAVREPPGCEPAESETAHEASEHGGDGELTRPEHEVELPRPQGLVDERRGAARQEERDQEP